MAIYLNMLDSYAPRVGVSPRGQ